MARKTKPAVSMPPVVDCRQREAETPRFTVLGTADIRNRLAWEFEYQLVLDGGELGRTLQVRQIFAADYERAESQLRKLLGGFGVQAIPLYGVRAPATPTELVFLDHVNRQLSAWRESRRPVNELVFS